MADPELVNIVKLVKDARVANSLFLSGFVVLVFDHLLTFSDEVELIWKRKFGLVSFIFLFNRYSIPAVLTVQLWEESGIPQGAILYCKIWSIVQEYITLACFMFLHFLVAMRVHILYNGRRRVQRFLWAASILYTVVLLSISVLGAIPVVQHLHINFHACLTTIPPFLWSLWLPSIIFEALLFALTANIARARLESGMSYGKLYHIIYKDGMLYFAAISSCSFFSLFVWAFAHPALAFAVPSFALALANVAGSHLILNLKSIASQEKPISSGNKTLKDLEAHAFGRCHTPAMANTRPKLEPPALATTTPEIVRPAAPPASVPTRFLHSIRAPGTAAPSPPPPSRSPPPPPPSHESQQWSQDDNNLEVYVPSAMEARLGDESSEQSAAAPPASRSCPALALAAAPLNSVWWKDSLDGVGGRVTVPAPTLAWSAEGRTTAASQTYATPPF